MFSELLPSGKPSGNRWWLRASDCPAVPVFPLIAICLRRLEYDSPRQYIALLALFFNTTRHRPDWTRASSPRHWLLRSYSLAGFCTLGYNSILVHALPTASSAIPRDPGIPRHAIIQPIVFSFDKLHTTLLVPYSLRSLRHLERSTDWSLAVSPLYSRTLVARHRETNSLRFCQRNTAT